jgi:hypothetical protein
VLLTWSAGDSAIKLRILRVILLEQRKKWLVVIPPFIYALVCNWSLASGDDTSILLDKSDSDKLKAIFESLIVHVIAMPIMAI